MKKTNSEQFSSRLRSELNNKLKFMNPNGTILIATTDEIIFEQFLGYSDRDKKKSTSSHTQFLIGSITKQFTAVSLLKALYEKSKMIGVSANLLEKHAIAGIQKPISHYLPKEHEIWSHDMPKWAETVTLHQLLVHSSGIPNYTSVPGFEKQTSPKASDLVTFFKNYPVEFMPGTHFSYNNSGYFLLGIIIQAITNQSLDSYMHHTFFEPLGMNSTFLATEGTVIDLIKSDFRFNNLALGYTFDVATTTPEITEVKNYALMQMPGGGGSLISNAADLLKWNVSLYSDKIIPKTLKELMIFPHIQTENPNEYYGYGIEIKKTKKYEYYIHRGGIPGFHSLLAFVPKFSLTIAILSNVLGSRMSLNSEIETIQASLSSTLTESEKALETNKLLEVRFPMMIDNNKKYQLTSLEECILDLSMKYL